MVFLSSSTIARSRFCNCCDSLNSSTNPPEPVDSKTKLFAKRSVQSPPLSTMEVEISGPKNEERICYLLFAICYAEPASGEFRQVEWPACGPRVSARRLVSPSKSSRSIAAIKLDRTFPVPKTRIRRSGIERTRIT
jgi:hypothetical protein